MEYLGITYELKHKPKLDPEFIPFGIWMNEYEKGADMPIAIAVERNDGFVSVRRAAIHNTPEMAAADYPLCGAVREVPAVVHRRLPGVCMRLQRHHRQAAAGLFLHG